MFKFIATATVIAAGFAMAPTEATARPANCWNKWSFFVEWGCQDTGYRSTTGEKLLICCN